MDIRITDILSASHCVELELKKYPEKVIFIKPLYRSNFMGCLMSQEIFLLF